MKRHFLSLCYGWVLLLLAAPPAAAIVHNRTFSVPQVSDVQSLRYGISVPDDYDVRQPRPLVLALHPGGDRPVFYGSSYLAAFFMAPLKPLDAIIVAPDCPTRTWTDAGSDQAVMALLQDVLRQYAIDHRRILVTGYSMGGRGTWFMAARHADFFTAAITIAGSPEGEALDSLGRIPTFSIHSRTDEVVPIDPDRRTVADLERMGRPVAFEAVEGRGHFDVGSYRAAFERAVKWVEERWTRQAESSGR